MSILIKGKDFGPTEQVTSTKLDELVDNASFTDTNENSVAYTGTTGTCLQGGGLEVTSLGQLQIADSGVTTSEISDSAVTTTKIASSAVTTAKIANANVTNAKLETNAVTTAKITDDAVTQAKIADDAVGADQLASDAVVTASIVDSNVTTAKIADANVTTSKIADANVTTSKIADTSITTVKIADSSVTTDKIADSSVTTDKIANLNVTTAKIEDTSITTGKIANDAITTAKIADDVELGGNPTTTTQAAADNSTRIATTAYVTSGIANALTGSGGIFGTIDSTADSNPKIFSKNSSGDYDSVAPSGDVAMTQAGAFTISDDAVTTDKIVDNAVTTPKITDANVTTAKIADSNVTTAKIADSNVTKAKIENVANLKVLGNTSGSAAAPQEVTINDTDNMSDASDTTIATSESIKAYVDNSSADGFSPTDYTGGESVTFPNGLIMKWGSKVVNGDSKGTVTFDAAFPNACISAQATLAFDGFQTNDAGCGVFNLSTTGLELRNGFGNQGAINWFAIGR
jgi:hypothetical protein